MQCIKDKTHCKSTKQKNCIKCHLARTIHFYPNKQGNEINISCFNEFNRNNNLFRIFVKFWSICKYFLLLTKFSQFQVQLAFGYRTTKKLVTECLMYANPVNRGSSSWAGAKSTTS